MSRWFHGTIEVRVLGRLRAGGHPALQDPFADDGTARGSDARPVIPGSALKGALRETFERLARAVPDELGALCPVCPDGGRTAGCPVCALFGHGGAADSRCLVGTARLRGAAASDPPELFAQTYVQVAIDRRRRAQSPQRLFARETLCAGAPLLFDAPIRLEVPDGERGDRLVAALCSAAAHVRSLGSGRSTGTGEVQLRLSVSPATQEVGDADVAPSDACLVLEPLEPLAVGTGERRQQLVQTLGHIPGSTARGAVALALLRQGVDPTEPAFQAAFGPQGSARFGPLWPALERDEGGAFATPMPLTAWICKQAGAFSPRHEALHDRLVADYLEEELARVKGVRVLQEWTCREPGHPREEPGRLVRAKGALQTLGKGPYTYEAFDASRIAITRTALDRARGGVQVSQLYTIEALAPRLADPERGLAERLRFAGEVWGLPRRLLDLLDGADVQVGRARSRGLGRCRARFEPARSGFSPFQVRLECFDRLLRRALRHCGLDGRGEGRYAAVLLCGPLPLAPGEEAVDVVARACGGEVLHAHARRQVIGHYGVEPERPEEQPLGLGVAAGAVFLVFVPDAQVPKLEAIERGGLCADPALRVRGYGAAVVSHPFHVDRAPAAQVPRP